MACQVSKDNEQIHLEQHQGEAGAAITSSLKQEAKNLWQSCIYFGKTLVLVRR